MDDLMAVGARGEVSELFTQISEPTQFKAGPRLTEEPVNFVGKMFRQTATGIEIWHDPKY